MWAARMGTENWVSADLASRGLLLYQGVSPMRA